MLCTLDLRPVSMLMPMVVRWVLIRLVACFMATFSLSIPLVADAVHFWPLSEVISTLMPRVVWLVLRVEMSPWAPSSSPTLCTDNQAECLLRMMGDFWVR